MRYALLTALCLASVDLGAQTPRSYSYDFRLDPGSKSGDVITGTVRVAGKRARIDTDEHKRDGDPGYLLVDDDGRTVYAVHPDKKTYEQHDADEFARVVGTAMRAAQPVLKVSVHDARVDTARLGDGGTVAGRATQRVELTQRWSTSLRVLGFTKEGMHGSSVAWYWADPSFALMRNPLFDIVSTSLMALAASDNDFLSRADRARARLFHGSPLKATIRLTMTEEREDEVTTLRYEVTKITAGGVRDADLDLPRGYTRESGRTIKM
jgi:hypothetical protein